MSSYDYSREVRHFTDALLMEKLAVRSPDWDCGEHRWRQWKLALRYEAERRGLLSGVGVVGRDP